MAMAAPKDTLGDLRLLVQQVARSFYEPKFIIVMDQLARIQAIKDDDLASRMGMQAKELNKLTAVLVNDRLVKVYRRNELKEGATRAVGRQYYYIDYKHFCDVVKWRMSEMRGLIDKDLRNELDTKGYICPQCETSYTPLDVDRLIDFSTGAFHCEICRSELIDNENAESVRGSQDRMQRFNRQMSNILEGLRRIDEMVLPAFDVEAWVRANFSHTEVDATDNGDGLKIAGGRHGVEEGVGIVMRTDKDEATRKVEREREAEAKRQQNQMPAWHLTSTISGDLTALGIAQQARDAAMQSPTHILDSLSPFTNTKPIEGLPEANDVKPAIGAKIAGLPVDMKPVVNHQADYYDRYYAQLEAGPSQAKADDAGSWDGSDEEDVKPSLIELEFQRTRKRTRSNSPVAGIDTSLDRGSKFLRTSDGPVLSRSGSGSFPPTTATTPDGTGENTPSEDTLVSVNGIQMPFSTVTEEHHDMMTPDEYTAYFEVYQRVSG